jgi:hypothetical protein
MKKLILLLLLNLLITSCTSQKNFKKYYFPINSIKEPKVYVYVDRKDQLNHEYRKFSINQKRNILFTEYYSGGEINKSIKEKITRKGIELIEFNTYERNDDGVLIPVKAIILDKNVCKWKKGEEYNYTVKYKGRYTTEVYEKRRINRGFEKLTLNGIEYEVMCIYDLGEINSEDVDEMYVTYYAKNIGLIKSYFEDHHNQIELDLMKILSEKEFDKLNEEVYD